jgi:hypothetical protein
MNKKLFLSFLIVAIFSLGMISACGSGSNKCPTEITVVNGIIYENTITNTISHADVSVTCIHETTTKVCNWFGISNTKHEVCHNVTNIKDHTETTTSGKNGTYAVSFSKKECAYGDTVNVVAKKNDLVGAQDGSITTKTFLGCLKINIGIVNVPLVPEFGLIAGSLTLFGAVGIFLFVRNK